MPKDDLIISKALNAGMRRLLVAAFVHQNETAPDAKQMLGLHEALKREIARLVMRGKTEDGDDVVLTTAIRQSLQLFVDAAYGEASQRRAAPGKMQ